MSNLRPFQIFLLAGFGILAVVSLILLSGFKGTAREEEQQYGDRVLIWGTLDRDAFSRVFSEIEKGDKGFSVVDYEQIDVRTFGDTFVNAIAEGRSPDLVLISSSDFVKQRSKLIALSYETVPLRDFKDAYVDGAEIFARPDGVYALPLAVDPMVLYWNRDIFASNGLAQAPTTWEYIVSSVVPALTIRDNNRNILQSAIAFGEVRNVQNAKELLLLLAMQSGSAMIHEDNNRYVVNLDKSLQENSLPPLETAVQFFTNFSNSNNSLYSWNRSQPLDRNAFVSGDLAMYFGFGSEAGSIAVQNPNLNFDVASMPQGASATVRRTYGEFYGFAIPKASPNPQGAFLTANKLVSSQIAAAISENLGLAPVARTAVAAGSGDAISQVIINASLIARGWLDPNPITTDAIFTDMVEDVTSGRENLGGAVNDGEQKIRLAF